MKTERIQVSTEAGRGLELRRITPKLSRLKLPNKDQVLFWDGVPFAAWDGSYIYTDGQTVGPRLAALHKYLPSVALLNMSIVDFEYTLGQALSKAGLMLVRRLDP